MAWLLTSMNKTFKVETKAGKIIFVVERQMAHDTRYRVGSKIPGRGKVVEVVQGDPLGVSPA